MLHYTIVFLVVALIAGLLGFVGIAGLAAEIAKILFFVFLVLFVVSLIMGRRPPAQKKTDNSIIRRRPAGRLSAYTGPMKIFHCTHCEALVYFENTQCVTCSSVLAYLPDTGGMGALQVASDGLWTEAKSGQTFRLCANYTNENVCNWALPAGDPEPFCLSCRLNRVIPDLSLPANREAWARVELAKRRLVYSLLSLGLPVVPKTTDPENGVIFEFLTDDPVTGTAVLTGHDEGVIVLNIVEADDAEREKRRHDLGEPYRTLIGHFRHEIGHYYWDRLIKDGPRLQAFRDLFGDETFSYEEALKIHYAQGAPADWQSRFISSYATMHPWEDWAETWAHYLHMSDTLETAAACGLSLAPPRADEPALETAGGHPTFEAMIANWFPLTHVLNNLNRGLGLADGYPFVLSAPAIEKLRFVHETIAGAGKQAVPGAYSPTDICLERGMGGDETSFLSPPCQTFHRTPPVRV